MASSGWPPVFEEILRSYLPLLPREAPLAADSDLIELGLDSLGMVSLLLAVEEHFSVTFPEGQLGAEMFATPGALWRALSVVRPPDGVDPAAPDTGEPVSAPDGLVTVRSGVSAMWLSPGEGADVAPHDVVGPG
ncbi:phosphopantetheine-binding protein [Polymorphospora lycopeni]|uniref:Phosphopantetheine-binding protein n=1 Tax=Polymorphospora lycopeni TaxID=3140240 RepID=A0ABV5CQE3_9ACTN